MYEIKLNEKVIETTEKLYNFDAEFTNEFGTVCGVDEAGRGPLCGPVCIAAVILNPEIKIHGLNDSKKLNEAKREFLYGEILKHAIAYNIVLVHADVIDEINILKATLKGMAQAVNGLEIKPSIALIDGNKCPDIDIKAKAVVKGDANSASIAAASVLAKVTRDNFMADLAKKHPEYMLEKHKGYPTKQHYEIIEKHGILPFYRKSFLKKRGIV